MNVTREELAQLAEVHRRSGWRLNPAQWLLDNGRDFEPSPLPPGMRLRKPKQCYLNSMHLVWENPNRYVYVEGWASTPFIATSHAWCHDRETGLIVDTTWENGFDYVGVVIRTKYACEAIDKYCGSLIEDWECGYPIVTGAVPREVWEEPL
jgi:hypothetical protein